MISNNVEYRNKDRIVDIGSTLKPDSVFSIPDANTNKSHYERSRGLRSYSQYYSNKPESLLKCNVIFSGNNQTHYGNNLVDTTFENDYECIKVLISSSIYGNSFVGFEIKSPNISPNDVTDYIEDTIKEDLEFISALKETDSKDDLKAIDELYEYVDNLFDSNSYSRIVSLIEAVTKKVFSLRVLVGFLTITHSQKNRIRNRHKLIQAARQRAEQKGLKITQINSILKGF
ncbi:hypothetical protein [Flavobacterium sp.]|uniref:hypothetical protein n=1 Tax=Flavobacterium sp. TaxID=239 RepID=UPI0025F848A0|nr:hypothetical protein [Flavobacterium sp.]